MASSNRTPKSVLEAPHLIPVVVSEQHGQNRAGRRHVLLDGNGHAIDMKSSITIPKASRQPATNVPHVKI